MSLAECGGGEAGEEETRPVSQIFGETIYLFIAIYYYGNREPLKV